jgi:hypothetical protein
LPNHSRVRANKFSESCLYIRFSSRSDFIAKARAYNLWFNVARRNGGKEHKTPWELIHEREPKVDRVVCALPPIFLDELFMKKLDSKLRWGLRCYFASLQMVTRFTAPAIARFSRKSATTRKQVA